MLNCLWLLPLQRSTILLFFFNDTATTEIYTLSLHDALPISSTSWESRCTTPPRPRLPVTAISKRSTGSRLPRPMRSEEHTSELQSQSNLVCRLLLEKNKEAMACGTHVIAVDHVAMSQIVDHH